MLIKVVHKDGSAEENRNECLQCQQGSDKGLDEAVQLIRSKLPGYVQECMLASGFDTLYAIVSMDTDCDKHIDQVEEFIQKNFPGNTLYCNPHSTKCKFPPGHRIRIKQFVAETKSLLESRKRKQGNAFPARSVDAKKKQLLSKHQQLEVSNEAGNPSKEQNVSAITTQVRTTILKYLKGHQKELGKLKDIQETKSFSILVTRLASREDGKFSVKIRCEPCGNCITLHQQRKSNCQEAYSIKNWKRHISGCKLLLGSMQKDKMKQKTLLFSSNVEPFLEASNTSSKHIIYSVFE